MNLPAEEFEFYLDSHQSVARVIMIVSNVGIETVPVKFHETYLGNSLRYLYDDKLPTLGGVAERVYPAELREPLHQAVKLTHQLCVVVVVCQHSLNCVGTNCDISC